MADIDLPAIARAEYARRKRAWERKRDDAADEIAAGRTVTSANADLMLWGEIVGWLELGNIPADTRACARSARLTLEAMCASAKASDAAITAMSRLTRKLEGDAILRHEVTERLRAEALARKQQRIAA